MDNILKVRFQDTAAPLEKKIQEFHTITSSLEKLKLSPQSIESKYQAIALITHYLSIAELHMQINDIYFKIFRKNIDISLENARKMFSSIISKADSAFSIRIHSSLAENHKIMDALVEITPTRVYHLVFRMEHTLLKLRSLYPATSPMHVTLGRIYKEIAGFSINITNFKSWLPISRNLRDPHYEQADKLFKLIMLMVENSADMVMESYHVTKNPDTLNEAIGVLDHLENIQRLLKSPDEAETRRKKESWSRFL